MSAWNDLDARYWNAENSGRNELICAVVILMALLAILQIAG